MSNYLQIGQIFDDRYEIEAILGSGGIGTVFKCLQIDCERTIALKVLHIEAANAPEFQARFLREAKALSKLSHANIVNVYHMGLSSTGLPYIAMEYLNGQSVRQILNSCERLSVRRSFKIIGDTAKALSYVHQCGLVHRDLKPENIILVDRPAADTVKLVDFGFARFTETQEQKLTQTGEIMGTASYMSPEQCAGRAVDFRSDIYSLTSCLYELMTGIKPFISDSGVGVMYKHLNEPVPEIGPEQVDLYHPALNEIMSCGMAKDPGKRFSSMDEMAVALENALAKMENGGRRTSVRQNFVLTVLLSISLFSGAAFLFGMMVQRRALDKPFDDGKAVSKYKNESFRRLTAATQIRRLRSMSVSWEDCALVDNLLATKARNNAEKCELLFIRAQCTESNEGKIYYLAKAMQMCLRDSGIPVQIKLEVLHKLFVSLFSQRLNHQALEIDSALRYFMQKHDYPSYANEDDFYFKLNPTVLINERAQVADIWLSFGNSVPFRQMLREIMQNDFKAMGGPWALSMEDSLKLDWLEQARALITACASSEMGCIMSEYCRKFGQLEMAEDCLKCARAKVRITIGEDKVVTESAQIPIDEAYRCCELGMPKPGQLLLENFVKNDLEKMDVVSRPSYRKTIWRALMICGDTEAACSLAPVASNYSNGTSSCSQLLQEFALNKASEQTRQQAITLFCSSGLSINQRFMLAFYLGRFDKGEVGWTAAAAHMALSDEHNEIPRLLKLVCLCDYIPGLMHEYLPAEALRICDYVLRDLAENGLPLTKEFPAFKFTELDWLETRLQKVEILASWGKSKLACQQLDEIESNLAGGTSLWLRLFECELTLKRIPQAIQIEHKCNAPMELVQMAQIWCQRDDFKEAHVCITLAKSHDHDGYFNPLIEKEEAFNLLEQNRLKEAQQLLLKLSRVKVPVDYAKSFYISLACALELAHLDKEADEAMALSRLATKP